MYIVVPVSLYSTKTHHNISFFADSPDTRHLDGDGHQLQFSFRLSRWCKLYNKIPIFSSRLSYSTYKTPCYQQQQSLCRGAHDRAEDVEGDRCQHDADACHVDADC